jgi:hypothetical protein
MATKNSENSKNSNFALGKENIKLLGIGFAIIVLGFVLMIGGQSDDPKVFSPKIFDAQRIIIAPIIVVFGFFFEIWAIMKKPKE